MWTGVAIVVATILVLIDRNGKWPETLRIAKWAARFVFATVFFAVLCYFIPDTLTRWLAIAGCIAAVSLVRAYEKWWHKIH